MALSISKGYDILIIYILYISINATSIIYYCSSVLDNVLWWQILRKIFIKIQKYIE